MNTEIYVGNLSYEVKNSDLESLFSKVGEIVAVNLIKDRDTGRAKGFGFVEMQKSNEAEEAVRSLNETEFMGRSLIVSMAKTKKKINSSF